MLNQIINDEYVTYDGVDVSERTDINKTIASKECDVYHYWYFLDKDFLNMNHIFALVFMI